METYFYNDPRIQEWIDQITEKVFTVCLLTGVDSEAEFQRGCQIVTKVTSLLQGISVFPSEYLEDGLRQLIEQQLPDARVINNFPTFQATMERMLHEGMSKAIDSQNREEPNTLISTIENTGEYQLEDHNQTIVRAEKVPIEEFLTENAIPAFSSANITYSEIQEIKTESEDLEPEDLESGEPLTPMNTISKEGESLEDNTIKVGIEIDPPINAKAYGIVRTSQVPEHAESLKRVLSDIFPNSSVSWNINLRGQTFLAQVENVLILISDPEHPCLIEDFTKEGWKVYGCSSEDLAFPRRLERAIRQIQRSGSKPQIIKL
ncbi:MAG: hypothetical protein P4L49_11915 [Desulfosporosinus sp.]|nr:hypothetical protein [Desulfosporosinus sp.]